MGPTIASTVMAKTELEEFRSTLNLDTIENNINNIGAVVTTHTAEMSSHTDLMNRMKNDLSSEISSQRNAINNVTLDLAAHKETAVTLMFAAQSTSGSFIPKGLIKFDSELVDALDVYNPSTGAFKVKIRG